MRVDPRKVEFSCHVGEDCAHSRLSRVASGLAFGGLEEAVERIDEAVGLAALCPSDDAVEELSDHAGDVLHRRDLGPQDVGAPLLEHGEDDIDLLAVEDFAEILAIEPCAGRVIWWRPGRSERRGRLDLRRSGGRGPGAVSRATL